VFLIPSRHRNLNFIFMSRISTYNDSTLPIIQHFDSFSLVRRIDAAKNVDEVSFHYLYRESNIFVFSILKGIC
jgi:adenylate kinase family enzyme